MSVSSMTKFVRRISFAAALLLALSLSIAAHANVPPPPPVVNPDFGTAPTCNTSGWSTVGNVSALTEAQAGLSASNNCVARVQAIGLRQTRFAKLSQTLNVPTYSSELRFSVWAYSDNPNTSYAAQTITLRTANGSILFTQSRNITSTTPITFSYYLGSTQLGNQLTLEISTSTLEDIGSPYQSILYIDNVHFIDIVKPVPESPVIAW